MAVAAACGTLGCHGSASAFAPAGPAARSIATLGWVVLVGFGVTSLVMIALVVGGATRSRGTLHEHAPIDVEGGQRWIFYGGFLVPAVVLGLLFVFTLREVDRHPLHDGGHYRPDIRVIGHQWWWEIEYLGRSPDARVKTANEIHIPVGWPVEIELESRDVIHSFWVPTLHGKVDLVPGQRNHIRVEADTPGRYDGQCAEYCGAEHTQMRYGVVVESLEDYERWLAHEAMPAEAPLDAEAAAGKELLETQACGVCHTVRGTRALSTVGPDLTHFAERRGLAAYSLPNSRAYLEAWITHAQSFKPGAQMPDLTEFDGVQLQALTHYLEQLK